jgi:hypothetical protein
MKAQHSCHKIGLVCHYMRCNAARGAAYQCEHLFKVPSAVVWQICARTSYARYAAVYERKLYKVLRDIRDGDVIPPKWLSEMAVAIAQRPTPAAPVESKRTLRSKTQKEIYDRLDALYTAWPVQTPSDAIDRRLLAFKTYIKEHLYFLECKNNQIIVELTR